MTSRMSRDVSHWRRDLVARLTMGVPTPQHTYAAILIQNENEIHFGYD